MKYKLRISENPKSLWNKSIEASDLLNFSNNLNTQIQEIRKEIDSNSKDNRAEIESKLNNINKQLND